MTSQENYENNANLSPCDHHIPLSRGIYLESLGERVTKVTKENAVLLLSASINLTSSVALRTPYVGATVGAPYAALARPPLGR
jgi:hypothetical protein